MDEDLRNSEIISEPTPHMQIVLTTSGLKKVVKYPRENYNCKQRLRELIHEATIQMLLAYAGISNPPNLVFHNLRVGLVRDELELSWSLFDQNLEIKIANEEKFPLALVIDYITRQRDRTNKENTRLQKLENGSYLFLPTDNGESLLGINGELNSTDDIDSIYINNLLFASKVETRQELEDAINKAKSWPLYKIIFQEVVIKFFSLGCTFSKQEEDFILQYCDKVLHFIEQRVNNLNRLILWYDEKHPPINLQNQMAVAN